MALRKLEQSVFILFWHLRLAKHSLVAVCRGLRLVSYLFIPSNSTLFLTTLYVPVGMNEYLLAGSALPLLLFVSMTT